MTAPHARQPQVLPRAACTPTAIRAVLAANADGDILQRYDEDLDAAFEQAREQGDVTPLVQTVKRWWFEADAWRDPQAKREFLESTGAPVLVKPFDVREVRRLVHRVIALTEQETVR